MRWGFALLFYFIFNNQILTQRKLKAELQQSPGCNLGSPCWYRTFGGENKAREHWLLFGKGAYFLLGLQSSWSWHKLLQCFKLFSRRVAIHLGNLKEQIFLSCITRETDPELQPLPDRSELVFKYQLPVEICKVAICKRTQAASGMWELGSGFHLFYWGGLSGHPFWFH